MGCGAAGAASGFPSLLVVAKVALPLAAGVRGVFRELMPIGPAHFPFGFHFACTFMITCKAMIYAFLISHKDRIICLSN